MATVNLGRIKPVNKGTWSSATTYAIDDFVQYTDNGVLSTYIAVAASSNETPSTSGTENGTYWKYMSKGTNIAVGNNKIVTSDGSGNLAGLSIGTAGQLLKVNSGANGFEFAAQDPAGLVKAQTFEDSTRRTPSDTADSGAFITFTYNKLKDGSTTKLIVIGSIAGRGSYSDSCAQYLDCQTGSLSTHGTNDSAAFKGVHEDNPPSGSQHGSTSINKVFQSTALTVGNHTFEYGWRIRDGSSGNKPFSQFNPNSSDDGRKHQQSSTFTVFEVLI
jgi:hypothetical protein